MLFKVWNIFTSKTTGKKHYYNILSDKSQFSIPDNLDQLVEGNLPPDWVEVKDEKPYYFYNQKTNKSTYSGSMIIPIMTTLSDMPLDVMQNYYDNIPVAFNDISDDYVRLKTAFGKDFKYEPLVITGCLYPIEINSYLLKMIKYPIKSLSISGCKTDDETLRLIGNMKSLTSLNISANYLSHEKVQYITHKLPLLTSLDISDNSIGNKEIKAILGNLKNLTSLEISGTNIDDEGAKALTTLTNLTYLDISNNRIGDEGVKAIAKLTNLTYLNISSNVDIGPKGVKAISDNLKKLTSLRMFSISDEDVQALKEGLPLLTEFYY